MILEKKGEKYCYRLFVTVQLLFHYKNMFIFENSIIRTNNNILLINVETDNGQYFVNIILNLYIK